MDSGGFWGDAEKPTVYPACLEVFASEPNVDIVVSRYTLPQTGELGALEARLSELETARAAHPDKLFPILSRTSIQYSDEWLEAIRSHRLVFLQGYGHGLRALGRLAEYSRAVHGEGTEPAPSQDGSDATQRQDASGEQAAAGRTLGEVESKGILASAGIPTIETVLANTPDEAVAQAERLGYPVALKVSSPEIVHKSDQGGVLLGLNDAAAVKGGFAKLREVAAKGSATFEGVTVQPMAAPGLEIILGGHRDPQFGPVIAFGLGGVFVEVLNDIALRVAPLSARDAKAMLDEIQGRSLLDGARGQPACDRSAITDALCRLSELMLSRPDIASIDANPAFAYSQGLVVVDGRVQLV